MRFIIPVAMALLLLAAPVMAAPPSDMAQEDAFFQEDIDGLCCDEGGDALAWGDEAVQVETTKDAPQGYQEQIIILP